MRCVEKLTKSDFNLYKFVVNIIPVLSYKYIFLPLGILHAALSVLCFKGFVRLFILLFDFTLLYNFEYLVYFAVSKLF